MSMATFHMKLAETIHFSVPILYTQEQAFAFTLYYWVFIFDFTQYLILNHLKCLHL